MFGSSAMLAAWLAILFHGAAQAALPSNTEEAPAMVLVPVSKGSDDDQASSWSLPPVRLGGSVSYNVSRQSFDGINYMQSGLMTTMKARTDTHIWQPWFARLSGTLGFSKSTDSSQNGAIESSGANVMVTGNGQLSVLSQSKFPFEAHFERNDNRVSSDLALANGYASRRYGFSQRYYRPEGEAMLGWDRNTQTGAESGSDLQDSLLLQMSNRLENHQLQFNGSHATNRRKLTGESAKQDNFSLLDNYDPDPSVSVMSMANVSSSDLHLKQGDNTSRTTQLSSNLFWRPVDQKTTVNAGARLISLASDGTGYANFGDTQGTRALALNANVGVNYEYNRFTRINAGMNVSSVENKGVKSTHTIETLGVSYQPDDIDLRAARYNWGGSANAYNRSGGDDSESNLVLQINHRLSRSFTLEGGSIISLDAGQSFSTSTNSGNSNSTTQTTLAQPMATQQLTQNGSISWDLSRQTGAALIRMSASDSRALDGNQEYFQLINFQASSSLPTSGFSSWTGNLTYQAARQGNGNSDANPASNGGTVRSASGALNFQNRRLFGVRNLRFGSDIRLNIQSQQSQQSQQLQLESRTNQEAAAWSNSIDYSIGRTLLRFNAMVSRNSAGKNNTNATGVTGPEDARKINRSVNFTVSRSFGMF